MKKQTLVRALFSAAVLALSLGAQADPIGYGTSLTNLYSVDLGNATSTLVGAHNVDGFMESLAIGGNGALFGANTSGELYAINSATGNATLIGLTGLGNVEALDFLGNVLLAVDFTGGLRTVYSVSLVDASVTALITSNSIASPVGNTGNQWVGLGAVGVAVPEPGTFALLAIGLFALGLCRRQRLVKVNTTYI